MVVRPPLALSTALMALGALLAVAACAEEGPDTPPIDQNGTVGGRVLMTLDGPLVGAAVSIDHTEYQGETIQVRSHVADLVTDDRGAFETLTGTKSGFFIITTRGGSFRDYATGETVVLDEADGLTALLYIDTLEDLTTGLVTPFTHLTHKLIDARTQARLDIDLVTSHALVNDHVDRHLGELTWERAAPRRPRRAAAVAHRRGPRRLRPGRVVAPRARDRDRRRRDRAAGQPVHAGPRPRPRRRRPALRRQ
jgi:hypothetical protein